MNLNIKKYELELHQVEILRELLTNEIKDLKKLSNTILKEKPSKEFPESFKSQEYEDLLERLHSMSYLLSILGE